MCEEVKEEQNLSHRHKKQREVSEREESESEREYRRRGRRRRRRRRRLTRQYNPVAKYQLFMVENLHEHKRRKSKEYTR